MSNQVTYTTKRGDVLDKVCHDYYGERPGAYEYVLNANPGLSKIGPVLPAGLVITMPDLPAPKNTSTVLLWE